MPPQEEEIPSLIQPPAAGHPPNLTSEQLDMLRDMWIEWHLWLVQASGPARTPPPDPLPASPLAAHLANGNDASTDSDAKTVADNKEAIQDLLNAYSAPQLEQGLWDMAKMEDPDSLLCRFLRARKWNLPAAMGMFAGALKWRLDCNLEALIRAGEPGNSRTIPKFSEQAASGKACAFGATLNEQPVTYLHVKKHLTSGQPEATMQKYIQYAVEGLRQLTMSPPQDRVTMVFNVEGFGLKNMDWQTVVYVLRVLEKFYPECLGTLYVMNAPWLFGGFWRGLAPMLDPVVQSKVKFINSSSDAKDVIPPERFLASLGGTAQYNFNYQRSRPGENDKIRDVATYEMLRGKRDEVWLEYSAATQEWGQLAGSTDTDALKRVLERRRLLAKKIRIAHFDMEPYYRPTNSFDRNGIIDRQGLVTWRYPQKGSNKVLKQVCGRLFAAPTLRREVEEVETRGLSIDEAEAKSRKAMEDKDWIALYGSVERAIAVEGPGSVPLPGPTTTDYPSEVSTPATSQAALSSAYPTPATEQGPPDLNSRSDFPSRSTSGPTMVKPTPTFRPFRMRRDSSSSARSVESFTSALSEMPSDIEDTSPDPRRLPGRPYVQIGGPSALEIGREQVTPAPGSAGMLTEEEEGCLREMWAAYFACKQYAERHVGTSAPPSATPEGATPLSASAISLPTSNFSSTDGSSPITPEVQEALDSLIKAYGNNAIEHIWEFIKMDNPDSLILRFLRARKWEAPDALIMAIDCIKWRLDFGVEALVQAGDLGNAEAHDKFLDQQRAGKTYAKGTTSATQQPICYIHVGKHVTSAQSPETMEKFVVESMETFRLLMTPAQEKATIFFDLTGFGLKNMDWTTVTFIIQCFESYYPECLGTLFVHNAPWLFSGIWHVITPMLDPVVKSKIIFTSTAKDCANVVPPGRLLAALGGNVDNGFKFVEPTPNENALLNDVEGREQAMAKYFELVTQYEDATRSWIASEGRDLSVKHRRAMLTKQLRVAHFDLDPYVRGQTVYHRNGTLDGQGKVTWLYRQKDGHLIRHVVGRISCVGTLEREIAEMQAGATVEEVERKSSEALQAADWLTLYGDPAVANHLEGTSYPVQGAPPPAPATRDEDPVAVAAAAAAAAATAAAGAPPPVTGDGQPNDLGTGRPGDQPPNGEADSTWTESVTTSVTDMASEFAEKMSNLQDFVSGAPSTLSDFLAAPYQRSATASPGRARRSTSSRRSSRRLSTQIFSTLGGWDSHETNESPFPTGMGHQRAHSAVPWSNFLHSPSPISPRHRQEGWGNLTRSSTPAGPLRATHTSRAITSGSMRPSPTPPPSHDARLTSGPLISSPIGSGAILELPDPSDDEQPARAAQPQVQPQAQPHPLLSPHRPQDTFDPVAEDPTSNESTLQLDVPARSTTTIDRAQLPRLSTTPPPPPRGSF